MNGRWGLAALVAIVAVVALSGSPATAQDYGSVVWRQYDVDLELRDDGVVHVVERQVVAFNGGSFSSGFAEIPMSRIDAIRNVTVSEETAAGIVAYEEDSCCYDWQEPNHYSWADRVLTTWIQWAFERTTSATRTFLIEYDVVGVVRVYPDNLPPNQQLWWTAIGREVTEIGPVRSSTVTLRLPRPVPLEEIEISEDDAFVDLATLSEHTTDGQTFTWTATDLGPGDNFIVRLQFPPLVDVAAPAWQQADDNRRRRAEMAEERRQLLNSLFLAIGFFGIAGGGVAVYGLWYLAGRDPHVGRIADFLPTPPDDLPPGAAGALIDEVAHERDVVATLVDLARRGMISMGQATTGHHWDTDVTLLKLPDDGATSSLEKETLRAIFGWDLKPGATVRLYQMTSRFAQAAPAVRARIYDELVSRGYFGASPESTREAWRGRTMKLFLLLLIAGVVVKWLFFSNNGWFWFPLGVLAILLVVLYLLSGAMPRKTRLGAEAAAKWLAFRRYLAELDRYDKVTEKTAIFEQYLPYAIAFGLEESWVRRFAAAGAPTPPWYAPAIPTFEEAERGAGLDRDRPRPTRDPWTTISSGRSWWDVGGGGNESRRREGDGNGDGGGFDFPDLPDWQGTSDHAGRALSRTSDGLLSMFSSAGRALSAVADAAASGSENGGGGGGSWGSSSRSSSRSSGRSFGGGGSRGGSSGGGRRGFR